MKRALTKTIIREIKDFLRNVKREWIRNARLITVNNERSLIEA
jgi:hypothetical protein